MRRKRSLTLGLGYSPPRPRDPRSGEDLQRLLNADCGHSVIQLPSGIRVWVILQGERRVRRRWNWKRPLGQPQSDHPKIVREPASPVELAQHISRVGTSSTKSVSLQRTSHLPFLPHACHRTLAARVSGCPGLRSIALSRDSGTSASRGDRRMLSPYPRGAGTGGRPHRAASQSISTSKGRGWHRPFPWA